MTDLVERLRGLARRDTAMSEFGPDEHIAGIAADRIESLEEKLHRIEQWCAAYPRTVFIEPTKDEWKRANEVLDAADDCPSLTAISGSNMRHVVEGIQTMAALGDKP